MPGRLRTGACNGKIVRVDEDLGRRRAALVRYVRDAATVVDLGAGAVRPAPDAARVLGQGPVLSFAGVDVAFSAVCAVTDTVVTVPADRQLAVLHAPSGSPIAYDPQIAECPKQLGDDLLVLDGGDTRLLRAAR